MAAKIIPVEQKFDQSYAKVGDCWLWQKARSPVGYGRFYHSKGEQAAHRYSFERFVGPIPDGLEVMHRCDVPSCVNPEHLTVGTQLQNMHDMRAKGRCRAPGNGELNGSAKLNAAAVLQIKALRAGGETYVAIAKVFGVTPNSVRQVCTGRTWTHVR